MERLMHDHLKIMNIHAITGKNYFIFKAKIVVKKLVEEYIQTLSVLVLNHRQTFFFILLRILHYYICSDTV